MDMIATKFDVSIRQSFRCRNKDGQNERQDPTKHLSFIPSWDKEFLYLLGLEKVVQFRGECLDKIIFVPDKCADKGKQKKLPSAHSPKDPFTCAQCNTDFSSSWNQDKEGSILCWSCFQCTWRKEHWTLNGPKDYHLRPTFGNFSSPVLTPSHPVHTDFQVKQEASSYLLPLKGDQQVPKISASVYSAQTNPLSLYSSSFYVDSSSCSSSPSSSDLLSTPVDVFVRSPRHASSSSLSSPTFYFSSSSYSSSPSSSDGFSSPVFLSSNSGTSSPSDGSSSLSLPSTSELHSSSPLPFYSPPHCTTKQALQKGRPPYWMQISLPPLCKDDKVNSKEIKNEKNGHWTGNRLQHEGEKTNQCMFELTHTCMSLTSAVFSLSPLPLLRPDKYNLQKPQICHTDLALPSKAPSTLIPSLKKTARMEHIKKTMLEKLKPSQDKQHKASFSTPSNYISAAPGSLASPISQYLPKVTIHHVPSAHSTISKTTTHSARGEQNEKPKCCKCKSEPIESSVRKSE